jgi:glycosyltransferase involved in cell wall biosynthesis
VIAVAWIAFGCAAVPALLYLWNSFLFREPPLLGERRGLPPPSSNPAGVNPAARRAVSVLIPARNEERGIAACVESVLASEDVELELIVLDDHSTDRTAEIVREIAAKDARVRVELAPPLPDGWCGKQHACFELSKLAKYDVFTFLDADVRLEPDALARMVLFLETSSAALVSGFPQQETGTLLEKLLIPLIHWLLLSFLPLWAMRRFRWSAFGAGCGQWFMTTRAAYEAVGGHEAVKSSLHDGLTLPRAYRRAGFMTDVCDATNIATCRMYRSGREVWFGLAKNAREGMAATGQIAFWTVVLLLGQVVPFAALVVHYTYLPLDPDARRPLPYAAFIALMPRIVGDERFRQSVLSSFLHPVGILLLLAIQWYAIFLAVVGKPVGWKGRAHPATQL